MVPDLKESGGGLRDATVLEALAVTWRQVDHVAAGWATREPAVLSRRLAAVTAGAVAHEWAADAAPAVRRARETADTLVRTDRPDRST